jgi:glutamate synthase (NADPH/NADH) small chain
MNINDDPMAIRQNELYIIEKAFENDWITPCPPTEETGKSVAVIGSGPAGLAAAQQLRRVGHRVVVYEKSDTFGGLLRYGIPEFKLEKNVIDRRIEQMKTEGVIFEGKVDVGVDISADFLIKRYDAVCICIGAGVPRDLPVPGRELDGIHFAMDYLTQQTQKLFGVKVGKDNEINAKGKNVVVIGGGDTGSDCLGTALRQGAKSVVQMEILPAPPEGENPDTPWPEYPRIYRTSSSHEEGGERRWSVCTTEFLGKDGRVTKLKGSEVKWSEPDENGRRNMEMVKGSEFELPCDLAVLAMGFTQPVHEGLLDGLGVEYDNRGNVKTDAEQRSSVKGVYAAGDANTGASLVVRCIAAGRRLAHTVDLDLMGESDLPTPD